MKLLATSRILSLVAIGATLSVTFGLGQTAQAQGAAITTLHTFDNTYGSYPAGVMQATDGNFYGTTYDGGLISTNPAGYGTIFRINPTTHKLTTLIKFNGANGQNPSAGLIQATDGNFYGTTSGGGANSYGTIFRLTPAGQLKVLYNFTDGADGAGPLSGVIQGTDGNFYGTCIIGPHTRGNVFKLTPDGKLTVLHKFDKATGADPLAGVVQGSDGSFYGTTSKGGANDDGVVYRVRPNGSYTILHTFDGRYGAEPQTALTLGPDGNFYGTTLKGGAVVNNMVTGDGTLFKISPTGAFSTLYVFSDNGHGEALFAPLSLGSDGNFYGATENDTDPNYTSTVFRFTPGGVLTTLYKFRPYGDPHGYLITTAVVQGTDGALYGVTEEGGVINGQAVDYGTIFKLTLP